MEFMQISNQQTWIYLRSVWNPISSCSREETPFSMFLKPMRDPRRSFTLWMATLSVDEDIIDPKRFNKVTIISPTTCIEVMIALASLASTGKLEEKSFNLSEAYQDKITKPDYNFMVTIGKSTTRLLIMIDPEAIEYECEDKFILVKILSTLFGLLESAVLWYQYLNNTLKNGGYILCPWILCLWRWSDYDVNCFIIGMYMDNYIHVYKGKVVEIESNTASYEVNLYDLEREKTAEQSSVWFLEQDITKTSIGMINCIEHIIYIFI